MITEKPFESCAEDILSQIEIKARKSFLPIIGPLKGKYLAEEIRKAKPRHVLEVGTLIGYSAILMGKELGKDAEIVTIEIHREEAEQANENIIKANLRAKIEIIVGDAIQAIPTLRGHFDFAFIDAEKSDLFDVLANVAYAMPPQTREVRAANAKVHINTRFNAKQQVFLDFVLSHYVSVGVEELDQEKLTPLLRLKYHNSIADAVADLGKPEDIGSIFAGFQKYLYQAIA